ncbi:MAG: Na+/H+ antiporter subunit D [Trueperaceae bacterium]|nr:Na+/H+ antiporter subunit D [Trueperaceae bacterium]
MTWLLVSPILIPLAAAAVSFALPERRMAQRAMAVGASALLLATSLLLLVQVATRGMVVMQAGDWPAPFGITLIADHLAAIMVVISAIMALATAVYALVDIDPAREGLGYHPLFLVLVTGINGAFLTGDLFNLYVWFEVLLISSFVLLTLGNRRAQLEGGLTYVAVNLVSSLFFLVSIGVTYGLTGTLNMADLAIALKDVPTDLVTTLSMLFLVAFGIKAAIFPLFFWLPASYHTPPVAISAIFAGMLTKVGVYALLRAFTLLFTQDVSWTHNVLLWLAGATMVTGVLGAAAQNEIRKILSFHIISQIGYMIMGLALFTPLALAGAVFYLVHHIIVKANLFFVAGLVRRMGGSFDLKRLGGLYRHSPLLSILFIVPAFSLAGFPPLSGFWAKLVLVLAGVEVGNGAIVAVALVVGLLTIFSMTKIWQAAFWSPAPEGVTLSRLPQRRLWVPVAMLAGLTVVIGLFGAPFMNLAEASAAELLNPAGYVEAVLGADAAEAYAAPVAVEEAP